MMSVILLLTNSYISYKQRQFDFGTTIASFDMSVGRASITKKCKRPNRDLFYVLLKRLKTDGFNKQR